MTAVVDAHQHLWDPAAQPFDWLAGSPLNRRFGVDDLEEAVSTTAVTATVLVQAVPSTRETETLLELARGHPLIAGVVGWADLTSPGLAGEIERLRALGPLVGLRHPLADEADPDWIAGPAVIAGLEVVRDAGLAFDALLDSRQRGAVRLVSETVPGLPLILDHAGKPEPDEGDEWRSWLHAVARTPSTVCKLSGLLTDDPRTETVFESRVSDIIGAFGPDRVMFGSDWPVSTLGHSYRAVLRRTVSALTALDGDEQRSVLAGTATATYRLR